MNEQQKLNAIWRKSSKKKWNQKLNAKTNHKPKPTVAVVVSFFICWSFFHAQRIMAGYIAPDSPQLLLDLYKALLYVSGITYYLTATINPICYQISSLKFRLAFKETFGCWFPFLRWVAVCNFLFVCSLVFAVHRIGTFQLSERKAFDCNPINLFVCFLFKGRQHPVITAAARPAIRRRSDRRQRCRLPLACRLLRSLTSSRQLIRPLTMLNLRLACSLLRLIWLLAVRNCRTARRT